MEKEPSSERLDGYQERYIAHQLRKKESLINVMGARHSDRIFSGEKISDEEINIINEMIGLVPSSCNRKAVSIRYIDNRDQKALLGGLLVGGVGWIHAADKIILIIANMTAYKENLAYMPYLDGGIIAQQLYLTCTAINVKCCFVNPNIREENHRFFEDSFLLYDEILLGAMAIGK